MSADSIQTENTSVATPVCLSKVEKTAEVNQPIKNMPNLVEIVTPAESVKQTIGKKWRQIVLEQNFDEIVKKIDEYVFRELKKNLYNNISVGIASLDDQYQCHLRFKPSCYQYIRKNKQMIIDYYQRDHEIDVDVHIDNKITLIFKNPNK